MGFAAIVGTVGTGKTLCLTKKGYEWYRKGYIVYSNYKLNFPHVLIESLEDLDKMQATAARPGVALFDEFWRWLDSRQYKKQKNDVVSKIIFYSRKRHIQHVYYTTQNLHQVEKRIRDLTDAIIKPELASSASVNFQGKKQEIPLKCIMAYYSLNAKMGSTYTMSRKPLKTEKFFTLPIMTLYNTREEVNEL